MSYWSYRAALSGTGADLGGEPDDDITYINMQPRDRQCVVCGNPATPGYGVPMFEDRLVPNNWKGAWGGFPACRDCYEDHQRGAIRTLPAPQQEKNP